MEIKLPVFQQIENLEEKPCIFDLDIHSIELKIQKGPLTATCICHTFTRCVLCSQPCSAPCK